VREPLDRWLGFVLDVAADAAGRGHPIRAVREGGVPCRSRRRHRRPSGIPRPGRRHLSTCQGAALSLLGILRADLRLKEPPAGPRHARRHGAPRRDSSQAGYSSAASAHSADPLLDLRPVPLGSVQQRARAMLASVFVIDGTFLFLSQYLQLLRGPAPFPPRSGCYPRPAAWSPDQSRAASSAATSPPHA